MFVEVGCMLRAMALSLLVLSGALFSVARCSAEAQRVDLINGIGLIDYSRKQDFKVGTWVKYHITGKSEMGMSDDYVVTVLIAGEENFWGEDCFWVETWTEPKGMPSSTIANLMSYAIFDDSMAVTNMQLYSRKVINEIDPTTGAPVQVVSKRNTSSLKYRKSPKDNLTVLIDTLGTESVTVPHGTYSTTKIHMRHGIGSTTDVGDSSMRTEVREERMIFMSPKIPITGIVREDMENSIKRKTWKIGQSQDAPMHTMEVSRGSAMLVDFGQGLTPNLVPEKYRKSLEAQAPKKSTPAKKSTSSKSTARKAG
jgi:hypothetical protein